MRTQLFLVLGFLITGCAQPQVPNVLAVDSEFQPYVNSFVAQSQAQGLAVQVQDLVVTMKPELDSDYEMGVCYSYVGGVNGTNPPPTININSQFWVQLDDKWKEELVYHELGHCVLNRVHRPDEDQTNYLPLSIMNAYSFADDVYTANYTQYMYEMFHQSDLASALPLVMPTTPSATIVPATSSTSDGTSGSSDSDPTVATRTSTKVVLDANNKIVGWKCDNED
jgi:hypothetical protein